MSILFRVALVACSLALDVFAVSIGVGVGGRLSVRQRVRVGIAFASAEVGMNLVGLGVGAVAGRAIGDVASYVGFGALVVVGSYMIVEQVRGSESTLDLTEGRGLLLASLSISLDSLGVGFSIPYVAAPVPLTLAAIAVAAMLATALGLAFGRFFGRRVESGAGIFAGIALIGTGLVFLGMKLRGVG